MAFDMPHQVRWPMTHVEPADDAGQIEPISVTAIRNSDPVGEDGVVLNRNAAREPVEQFTLSSL